MQEAASAGKERTYLTEIRKEEALPALPEGRGSAPKFDELEITENPDIEEPGAAVIVRNPTVFSEIAQYGDTSEALARSLGKQIRGFLAASASIETHLADQIILPLFFTAGGSFLTKAHQSILKAASRFWNCLQVKK